MIITLFGSLAVATMVLAYWLEPRSRWFVLLFAVGCAATSTYSALVAAYPITVIEAIWSVIALRRFFRRHQQEASL
jgi:hypothetical protein